MQQRWARTGVTAKLKLQRHQCKARGTRPGRQQAAAALTVAPFEWFGCKSRRSQGPNFSFLSSSGATRAVCDFGPGPGGRTRERGQSPLNSSGVPLKSAGQPSPGRSGCRVPRSGTQGAWEEEAVEDSRGKREKKRKIGKPKRRKSCLLQECLKSNFFKKSDQTKNNTCSYPGVPVPAAGLAMQHLEFQWRSPGRIIPMELQACMRRPQGLRRHWA